MALSCQVIQCRNKKHKTFNKHTYIHTYNIKKVLNFQMYLCPIVRFFSYIQNIVRISDQISYRRRRPLYIYMVETQKSN